MDLLSQLGHESGRKACHHSAVMIQLQHRDDRVNRPTRCVRESIANRRANAFVEGYDQSNSIALRRVSSFEPSRISVLCGTSAAGYQDS